MTRPNVVLRGTRVEVSPGAVAEVTATVHNPSTTVEDYELSVVGAPSAWSTVVPPVVALMPDERSDVTVLFEPRFGSSAPVGDFAYGLLCTSTVDPTSTAVAEGDVVVEAHHGATARLHTVSSGGRWRGRYRVDITNTGSVAADVEIEVTQPEDHLSFALSGERLEVAPGSTACAYVVVRPRRPGGATRKHPFSVEWRHSTPEAGGGTLDATFTQRPVLPKRPLVWCTVLAVAAVGGLAAYRAWAPRAKPPPVAAPAPVLASADAVPGGVRLQWQAVTGAEGYQLRHLSSPDDDAVEATRDVDPAQTADIWPDLPTGEHCFVMVAVLSGEASATSEKLCATLAPVTPVSDIVVVHFATPTGDVGAHDRAVAAAAALQAAGVTVELATSADVPALAARGGKPSYVLFHRGFTDRAGADAYCARLADVVQECEPIEPLPTDPAAAPAETAP